MAPCPCWSIRSSKGWQPRPTSPPQPPIPSEVLDNVGVDELPHGLIEDHGGYRNLSDLLCEHCREPGPVLELGIRHFSLRQFVDGVVGVVLVQVFTKGSVQVEVHPTVVQKDAPWDIPKVAVSNGY